MKGQGDEAPGPAEARLSACHPFPLENQDNREILSYG